MPCILKQLYSDVLSLLTIDNTDKIINTKSNTVTTFKYNTCKIRFFKNDYYFLINQIPKNYLTL